MTGSEVPDTKSASSSPARRAKSSPIWARKDLYVAVAGVLVSGALAVAGVADVPVAVMFTMCCAITAVATLAARAITVRTLKQRVNALWLALITESLILVGVYIYQHWLDPSKGDETFLMVASEAEFVWYPASTPGGALGAYHRPVRGGDSVNVRCLVRVKDQGVWYWLDLEGWLPDSVLAPMPGFAKPDIPNC
jgi:hypothetical protein